MQSYEDYDYKAKLKQENAELKEKLERDAQEIVVYRSLAMLIGSMKACERFIDKEKAFDENMKYFENNFSATGAVK